MAVNGFEEQTHELNDYERNTIVPLMVKGLETKIGKSNAITNKQMIVGLKRMGHTVNGAKVRKLIHHIRITGLVECLIATSKGYYITNDKKEMDTYIESLIQRSESIMQIAKQMQFQRNKNLN